MARKPRETPESVLVGKPEIARAVGVNTATIDRWVAEGSFPPPHSRLGERTYFWRREHFRAYLDSGLWPDSAWPHPATRCGKPGKE